jgi:acetylornithine deacetylase/succinyl-diaminopimelate desuccinylase-like protein
MAIGLRSSFFSRVTSLAAQRGLHEAIRWLHLHQQQMIGWQTELIAIPAPPFSEAARSAWLAAQFRETGLADVEIDSLGNVFGTLHLPTAADASSPIVLLSAHLDTVFPADTPLEVRVQDELIEAPGACDNASGVIGMLAIARAMVAARLTPPAKLVFCGNVGEEGEGDLRGVRHIYKEWPGANRIVAHIVLDGAGNETAVTQALGSRRYRVTIHGPGGHSFTDAGTPNPILVLSSAFASLTRVPLNPYPNEPRVTLNIGTIQGGTSVNTIPESVTASVEFRSTAAQALVRMEVALHRAIEDAVEAANNTVNRAVPGNAHTSPARNAAVRFTIEKIGNRPAADSARDSAMLEAIKAVDRHLGLRTDFRLGSTDANIPLSLGIPSASLGSGGDGGGAHTRAEWYSAVNRDLGLRRILLLALTLLDWAASE